MTTQSVVSAAAIKHSGDLKKLIWYYEYQRFIIEDPDSWIGNKWSLLEILNRRVELLKALTQYPADHQAIMAAVRHLYSIDGTEKCKRFIISVYPECGRLWKVSCIFHRAVASTKGVWREIKEILFGE